MARAADGHSTPVRDPTRGTWHATVNFPDDPLTGRRVRTTRTGKTKRECAEKIEALRTARAGGYSVLGRDVAVTHWLDYWIDARVRAAVSP